MKIPNWSRTYSQPVKHRDDVGIFRRWKHNETGDTIAVSYNETEDQYRVLWGGKTYRNATYDTRKNALIDAYGLMRSKS